MENFIKEVELKLKKKAHYQSMLEFKNAGMLNEEDIDYNKLIEDIDNWLHEQVDLDLPVYVDRLGYYSYLKNDNDSKLKIPTLEESKERIDRIIEKGRDNYETN